MYERSRCRPTLATRPDANAPGIEKDDGTPDITALNGDFSDDYLAVKGNPRWVVKPAVAYLWARTVTCNAVTTSTLSVAVRLCRIARVLHPECANIRLRRGSR